MYSNEFNNQDICFISSQLGMSVITSEKDNSSVYWNNSLNGAKQLFLEENEYVLM